MENTDNDIFSKKFGSGGSLRVAVGYDQFGGAVVMGKILLSTIRQTIFFVNRLCCLDGDHRVPLLQFPVNVLTFDDCDWMVSTRAIAVTLPLIFLWVLHELPIPLAQ